MIIPKTLKGLCATVITLCSIASVHALDRDDISIQAQLLHDALNNVVENDAHKTEWYSLIVGGNAHQRVFETESIFLQNWFDTHVGNTQYSLNLVNGKESWSELPLASKGTIKRALKQVARKMDIENDVLLLSLISHGKKNELLLDNPNVNLDNLSAHELRDMLDETGIKKRVVVISACYSGSFIDELKDDNTMIITAASADRSSFGCSNDNTYTYFGRALFVNALNKSTSWEQAFNFAKKEVEQREQEMGYPQSMPQISIGKDIQKSLPQLEKFLFTQKNN